MPLPPAAPYGHRSGKADRLKTIVITLVAAMQWGVMAAPVAVLPQRDDEVIEVLPAVTRSRPPRSSAAIVSPAEAALRARRAIGVARQTGDTRYWGRAQAVLAPWWDRPDAPADLAVLQATVQQGRHEFDASRKVLTAALANAPANAQGWLNLAALERLSARYADALRACEAVVRAGQDFYGEVCRLETQSFLGQHQSAAQGLEKLIAQHSDVSQRSWLLSLLAETQERWGRDQAAAQSYSRSLALDAELYTAIAYSDLLLRMGQASQALQALAASPATDAVVLRQAAAWRRLGDGRWTGARAILLERFEELKRRGDDPALHSRELALIALWLDDDAAGALAIARRNLLLQREPLDWWVALQSARQIPDAAALSEIAAEIRSIGLQDSRLTAALKGVMAPVAKGSK